MSTPVFKPSESKREEFRKYLEKTGVMDTLTKVLVSLYEEPEKPEDALGFIRDKLAIHAGIETYAQIVARQQELQIQVCELQQKITELEMAATEGVEEEGQPEEGEEHEQEQTPQQA